MVTKRWKKDFEHLRRISLDDKTGFRNINGKYIVILDELGNIFYDTTELENIVWEFNLPPGNYYILQGKIAKMPAPVDYPIAALPKPERDKRDNPENFEVIFCENANTGTVFWDVKKIYLDNSLKELPLPCLVFVLYHEYAHRFYKTESACDIYARNRMIDDGYNPSQIGQSIIHTLSAGNYKRMENVVNTFI